MLVIDSGLELRTCDRSIERSVISFFVKPSPRFPVVNSFMSMSGRTGIRLRVVVFEPCDVELPGRLVAKLASGVSESYASESESVSVSGDNGFFDCSCRGDAWGEMALNERQIFAKQSQYLQLTLPAVIRGARLASGLPLNAPVDRDILGRVYTSPGVGPVDLT
jgi:hypothetical protein